MENLEENLKILLEKEIRKKPILKKGCVQDLFNIIFYISRRKSYRSQFDYN